MRRFLLILLFVSILPQISSAQSDDYWPFIEEGKRWVYDYFDVTHGENHEYVEGTMTYYIGGDTLSGQFKKVYIREDFSGEERYFGYISEDTYIFLRTILFKSEDDRYASPIFDFGLEKDNGFILTTIAWSCSPFAWKKVDEAEVTIRGRKTKLHIFKCPFTRPPRRYGWNMETLYWFEGIGSVNGFIPAGYVVNNNEGLTFNACYVGDELVATYEDLKAAIAEVEGASAVEEIEAARKRVISEGIYDLQGRKIPNDKEIPHGIYIRDGKKIAR